MNGVAAQFVNVELMQDARSDATLAAKYAVNHFRYNQERTTDLPRNMQTLQTPRMPAVSMNFKTPNYLGNEKFHNIALSSYSSGTLLL